MFVSLSKVLMSDNILSSINSVSYFSLISFNLFVISNFNTDSISISYKFYNSADLTYPSQIHPFVMKTAVMTNSNFLLHLKQNYSPIEILFFSLRQHKENWANFTLSEKTCIFKSARHNFCMVTFYKWLHFIFDFEF